MPRGRLAQYGGAGRPGRLRCAGRGSASLVVDDVRPDLLSARPSARRARREEAVMALSLPANPDLERFRRDARRLQRGVRDRDPRALELVTRHHPSAVTDEPDEFPLADAQLVVARSYGFSSWPRLRDYLRRSAGLRRDPTTIDDAELFDVQL